MLSRGQGNPQFTVSTSGCTGVDDTFSGQRNFFVAFDKSRVLASALETPRELRRLLQA